MHTLGETAINKKTSPKYWGHHLLDLIDCEISLATHCFGAYFTSSHLDSSLIHRIQRHDAVSKVIYHCVTSRLEVNLISIDARSDCSELLISLTSACRTTLPFSRATHA